MPAQIRIQVTERVIKKKREQKDIKEKPDNFGKGDLHKIAIIVSHYSNFFWFCIKCDRMKINND